MHAIQPQDEAMNTFRQAMNFMGSKVLVSEDGRIMKYRIRDDRRAAMGLILAQGYIGSLGLPLIADIEEWTAGPVVFDRWLVISYRDKELPCY